MIIQVFNLSITWKLVENQQQLVPIYLLNPKVIFINFENFAFIVNQKYGSKNIHIYRVRVVKWTLIQCNNNNNKQLLLEPKNQLEILTTLKTKSLIQQPSSKRNTSTGKERRILKFSSPPHLEFFTFNFLVSPSVNCNTVFVECEFGNLLFHKISTQYGNKGQIIRGIYNRTFILFGGCMFQYYNKIILYKSLDKQHCGVQFFQVFKNKNFDISDGNLNSL
eukprot:TRINITY_DN10956_c0_g1_i2.p1 TRINITY_DN10956_c0_g1~~TRINITY_DN10956_c0_g1_i2.p1  ORF type:complete len:221 (+),score=-6.56 TRINITY_DN10956_c0_g1_i2:565-1227(+)